jgi:hypothetical protein
MDILFVILRTIGIPLRHVGVLEGINPNNPFAGPSSLVMTAELTVAMLSFRVILCENPESVQCMG